MVRRTVLFGFGGATAILAVVAFHRAQPRPETPLARLGEDDVSAMRADLAALRARVDVSDRIALAAVAAAAEKTGPDAPTTRDAGPVVAAAPEPARAPISAEEMRVKLSGRFDAESPDPAWSKPATTLVGDHVHAGLQGSSRVRAVECRRTMCRVEAQHETLGDYRTFVDDALLFPHGGWKGPVMTQIVNPGSEPVVSVAYLFREGQDPQSILE